MENNFKNLFNDMIERKDLHGRSFTLGVALYTAMVEGWLDSDMENALDNLLDVYYGELFNDIKKYNIDITYNYRAIAEMLDIAALDSIARELSGEDLD